MKKKTEYSMTAKERKELRRAASAKQAEKEKTTEPPVSEEGAEAAAVGKKQIWIPILCAVLALVIILTAVLLLVIPRSNSRYPRATFTLGDGRELHLVLWEETCPIAATNFIFLTKIDFFNGTLVYDVQPDRNYMRFGAYTAFNAKSTRYTDTSFLSGIPRKIFNVVNADPEYANRPESNKFGYRLRKDTASDANRYGERYVLSYRVSDAADYVINLGENNRNFKSGSTDMSSDLVAFGKFEDEESQKILDELYGYTKVNNTGITNAVGTDPEIRITKVTVSNLQDKKWKDFEFISYMKTAYNGGSAFSAWRG